MHYSIIFVVVLVAASAFAGKSTTSNTNSDDQRKVKRGAFGVGNVFGNIDPTAALFAAGGGYGYGIHPALYGDGLALGGHPGVDLFSAGTAAYGGYNHGLLNLAGGHGLLGAYGGYAPSSYGANVLAGHVGFGGALPAPNLYAPVNNNVKSGLSAEEIEALLKANPQTLTNTKVNTAINDAEGHKFGVSDAPRVIPASTYNNHYHGVHSAFNPHTNGGNHHASSFANSPLPSHNYHNHASTYGGSPSATNNYHSNSATNNNHAALGSYPASAYTTASPVNTYGPTHYNLPGARNTYSSVASLYNTLGLTKQGLNYDGSSSNNRYNAIPSSDSIKLSYGNGAAASTPATPVSAYSQAPASVAKTVSYNTPSQYNPQGLAYGTTYSPYRNSF